MNLDTRTDPVLRFTRWVAIVLTAIVMISPPALVYYFSVGQDEAEVAGEFNIRLREIERRVTADPEFWMFEVSRLREILADPRDPGEGIFATHAHVHRIYDAEGELVVQVPETSPSYFWPPLRMSTDILDYGKAVGRLEVVHSIKDIYQLTLITAVLSFIVGIALLWILMALPLRLVRSAWERVSYMASHDAVTQLPNRVLFLDRLRQALDRPPVKDLDLAVLSIDLDHFKDVNDTLGHAAGDLLLNIVSERIASCVRHQDTVARFGGDEFAVLLIDLASPEEAATISERIIYEISRPCDLSGNDAIVGASIGIALAPKNEKAEANALIQNADIALYQSKNSGRGIYHFFRSEMDEELRSRKTLELRMRLALDTLSFDLHYQPEVNTKTGEIVAVEALIRWTDEELGSISPAEFIPVAESTGLMFPITEWVLMRACRDAREWDGVRVAVNLSPSLFQQPGLVKYVHHALELSGLPPEQLELEITEEILFRDNGRTLSVLKELDAIGVSIAMDDFGTGYSSLSYLKRFPFRKIKIDRSFISDLDQNEDARAIVKALVGMSSALNMEIIAEGVENTGQAHALEDAGCTEFQGFLFGKPGTREDMNLLLSGSEGKSEPQDEAPPPPLKAGRG